jgi:hypothetical protein
MLAAVEKMEELVLVLVELALVPVEGLALVPVELALVQVDQ